MKPQTNLDQFEQFSHNLPKLPKIIRYFDDYNDRYLSIHNPNEKNKWMVSITGTNTNMDFTEMESGVRIFVKSWLAYQIQSYAISTAHIRFAELRNTSYDELLTIVFSSPYSIRSTWSVFLGSNPGKNKVDAFKSILFFLCHFNLVAWTSEYKEFLATLPYPDTDKYSSVRTGDAFLSVEEEAIMVSYFDEMALRVSSNDRSLKLNHIRDAAVLVCCFQFGFRRSQIGMLKMRDVDIWNSAKESAPSVHLTFKMVKQRSSSKSFPMRRKVKKEWAPIFIELYERAKGTKGLSGEDKIFCVNSAREVSQIINEKTTELLSKPRSATEFRHTAAQRLVDAGCSKEELAEFMGHSDSDTGLVYFQSSPNQAERVNNALGISDIYQNVAKIAHDQFISNEELMELKGEQQIGAVPHGIPIAGIGGCSSGQPSCPSNPVTACYGCNKFMPINEARIHEQVLEDFRSVVTLFSQSSRGKESSPAYVQLKRTISNVQSILTEIKAMQNE